MNGLLIYDSIGAKRNEWFIKKLIAYSNENNLKLNLEIVENNTISTVEKIDFAIVRAIAPQLSNYLEKAGIKVFNNFKTSYIANNKWETYLMCSKLGIPTMNTQHNIADSKLQNFPYVIKTCDGHGGAEVFWAKSKEDYSQIERYLEHYNKDYIIQTPCSDLGKDMRIYLLGKNIVTSILRYNPNSFKSNYSLGGQVRIAQPTDYQIETAKQIANFLNSDYIGVDFIFHNGRWVLNEIEDVVGARMIYETSNIDVAKMYVNYISSKLKS